MGIEIVHDQDDRLVREMNIRQVLQHIGKVLSGPATRHLHMPPTNQRRTEHEQVGSAVACILEVIGRRLAGTRGQGGAGLLGLLPRGLVKADQDLMVCIIPMIDGEHILHRAHEIRIVFRRNTPAFL